MKYRKEVELVVQQYGENIKGLGRVKLNLLQQQLNLPEEEALSVEQSVLEPIRQRKTKLAEYRKIFAEAVETEYPFEEFQFQMLADIRKMLGLLDEDVGVIESEILSSVQVPEPEAVSAEPNAVEDVVVGSEPASQKATIPEKYRKLEKLLKAKRWKEADQETYQLMITTVGKEEGRWFDPDDLRNFPCEDLRTLDQLWVSSSDGKYGFSVQKKIWEECGSPTDYNDDWEKFGDRVSWLMNEKWVNGFEELDLDRSGVLPWSWEQIMGVGGVWFCISSLARRLVDCNPQGFHTRIST